MNAQIAKYEAARAAEQATLPMIEWFDASIFEVEETEEAKLVAALVAEMEAAPKNKAGHVNGNRRNAAIDKTEKAIVAATGKHYYEVRQSLWAATSKWSR